MGSAVGCSEVFPTARPLRGAPRKSWQVDFLKSLFVPEFAIEVECKADFRENLPGIDVAVLVVRLLLRSLETLQA